MKLRKRVIVAGLLMVAIGSAVYELKLYLEQKKRLEYLVVQAVSPYIKGSFQVGRVRLGFFSAHLNDVRVQLPAQALAITVDDIRVSLSPIKLLLSGFSLARSIGKIVLVGPTIEISVAPPLVSDSLQPVVSSPPVYVSRTHALEYLFVKNGVIRLKGRRGQVAVLGEQLQGRMWDTGTELNYNLTGKLGATRKNLFASGSISWRGEKHRLSLKLDMAEIRRPLVFKDVVITAGALTGALEFAFPDTVTFANIESNGWVRINHGTCRIGTIKKTFNSVNLSLSISDSRITIDSLSLHHSCARFRANGTWDLAGRAPFDRIDFQCRNLWLDSLGLAPMRNLCRVVGAGWARGTLERKKGSDAAISINYGGVTLWGTPLLGLFAHVKLQHSQLELDSLSLRSPALTFTGTGIVDYSKEPMAYGFQVNGAFDSLAFIQPRCNGKIRFSAMLNGVGNDRSGQITMQGKGIRYSGIPFGGVSMTAQMRGDSGVFSFHNEERGCAVKAGGIARQLFKNNPKSLCTLSLKVNSKSPFFEGKLAHCPRPDSLKAMVFFSGWSDTFHLQSMVDVYDPKVKGGVTLRCERSFSRRAPVPVEWNLEQRNLFVTGALSACNGAGRLYPDSLTIDSLVILDRAVVSGKVVLNKPFSTNAVCNFNIALKSLIGLIMKSGDAVESGRVHGVVHFAGPLDKIESRAEVHASDVKIGGVGTLETDATVTGSGGAFALSPVVLRKDGHVVAIIDTVRNRPYLRLSGKFDDLDLRAAFGTLFPEEAEVEGRITGSFHSSEKGFPIVANVTSPKISLNEWQFDSLQVAAVLDSTGIQVKSLRTCDGSRSVITATGFVPLSLLRGDENEKDTIQAAVSAKGDIIASLHRNLSGTIDGSGQGSLALSINGQPENWHVREGSLLIQKGTLILKPYLRNPIADFSCTMTLNDSSSVTSLISGVTGKRSVRIFSTHEIPKGYEPIRIGPLDLGIMQIETPQHGLDIHLPGFMEKGETGDLEPGGKSPFRYFSVAGPARNFTVIGILLLRNLEFTYPLLDEGESSDSHSHGTSSSPSSTPSITSLIKWEMDIKPVDRKVMYFRDISGNNTRLVRFLDAYIDQGSSVLHLRGCDNDNTLKISGLIKSYHGAVYYGKTFDRNFEAGLEFVPQKKNNAPGYDNRPILWGSAEAYSDTSRFDRIKLIALVQDPKTGGLSERGRLVKGRLNVVFRLSSDSEELAGASEREFYRQAGLQFTTLGSAGKFMSDFGEQNLHRIFLQRFERKLAKFIGLDVISIETSIASNYFTRFYNRQFDNQTMQMQADYLALANAGVTLGRYFWSDIFFVKASGGLLPLDTALTPQYSFGLEFQPSRYFFMNFDYGFYKKELAFERNPRINLQLRLPITGLRNLLDF